MPSPTFLLIDTTEQACTLGLSTQAGLFLKTETQARRHGDFIISMIASLFDEAGIRPHSLAGIGILNGPGAFTGTRIGVSLVQGLSYGWDVPCIPVCTLYAWAQTGLAHHSHWSHVACALDARMGETYFALYERSTYEPSQVVMQGDRLCIAPEKIPQSQTHIQCLGLVGSGALVYHQSICQQLLQGQSEQVVCEVGKDGLDFQVFANLVNQAFEQGLMCNGYDLEPVYLRPAVQSKAGPA